MTNGWFTVENRINTAYTNPNSYKAMGPASANIGQKTFHGGHSLRRNLPLINKEDGYKVSNVKRHR